MTLKKHKAVGLSLLVAFLATALTASAAGPEKASQGKFTLPQEVQWGTLTIPAGEYTFTLNRTTQDGVLTLRSREHAFMIRHLGTYRVEPKGESFLALQNVNGQWRVMQLYLAPVGKSFCYCHQSKASQRRVLAANRGLTKTIRITVMGK